MKKIISLICLSFVIISFACSSSVDMSGKWTVKLDPDDKGYRENWAGKLYKETIMFPGTTDDAGLGIPDTTSLGLSKVQLSNLIRKNSYVGAAWYAKKINVPASWKGKNISLNLERVIWLSKVWIDGVPVSQEQESLVAPHLFDLTDYIKPGKEQIITVCIDNRKRYDISVRDMAHAYTNQTQIIWNGILGDISLQANDPVIIDYVHITPDIKAKKIKTRIDLINTGESLRNIKLEMKVVSRDGKQAFKAMNTIIDVAHGSSSVELDYLMGGEAFLWDEFNPVVYTLNTSLKGKSISYKQADDFGLRHISTEGNELRINGRPLFLRGTLECAIFPLTGHPPMDHSGWEKVFRAARDWGLNHIRFHSWCPPKAAFEVADRMGIYLQVELPIWSVTIEDKEQPQKFMREEGRRIIKAYGNHPSFCFWSMGNELQKDIRLISGIMNELKSLDDRHLYTTTSFTFEKGHGDWPEPDDDFFITQWTKKGWVRGQGVFNQSPPSFDKDYRTAVEGMSVPLITHEIGQYSVYPNLKEIEKYTGVLKPLNFLSIQEDLKKKGLLHKAESYLMSSGKLAAILYKEEIERALKTPGISGFQLLDLHDFPGQGTALVGLLDAFWESKGVIEDAQFRKFSAPVVPLLRFAKATYYNSENFEAEIEISNYSHDVLKNQNISWVIRNGKEVLLKGNNPVTMINFGHNNALGKITLPLEKVQDATQLDIELFIDGTPYANSWKIWVYGKDQAVEWGNVKFTRDYAKALVMLQRGETVLYNPVWKSLKGIEGKFVPVFWSPVHFPKQAGTMGVLCDPTHKALSCFPTASHSDWQWWDLNINSTTLVVDKLKGFTPVVEMIDNFANNRQLASLLEGKYGKGKFMVASFDLIEKLDERPVAKQMLISLLRYMNSVDFSPDNEADFEQLYPMITPDLNQSKQDAKEIY